MKNLIDTSYRNYEYLYYSAIYTIDRLYKILEVSRRLESYSKILREVNEEEINFNNFRYIIIRSEFYEEKLSSLVILYKVNEYSKILF